MTKLTHNLGMKAVACFLVILSGLTSIISIITIVVFMRTSLSPTPKRVSVPEPHTSMQTAR